jgi:hypothetical protein
MKALAQQRAIAAGFRYLGQRGGVRLGQDYRTAVVANFLTMASSSFRSLSFRFVE